MPSDEPQELSFEALLGEPPAGDESQWTAAELDAVYERALAQIDAVESVIVATTEELKPGALLPATNEATSEPVPAPNSTNASEEPILSPRQVLEACLFVGGATLTAAKLASLLRGDYDTVFVEETIDSLNRQYAGEGRPYEIQLGEGGYRLTLRDEFERIRHKVYGLGPREVRLSQEVIEALALVAYHPSITEAQIDALGKPNSNAALRQLLRRDLIAVQRTADDPKTVRYVTTKRFLSLFGLSSLADLPRPEDFPFK